MKPVRHSVLVRGHPQRRLFAAQLWKASRVWLAHLRSGVKWIDASEAVKDAVILLSLRGWAVDVYHITANTRFWADHRQRLLQRLAITRANSY